MSEGSNKVIDYNITFEKHSETVLVVLNFSMRIVKTDWISGI